MFPGVIWSRITYKNNHIWSSNSGRDWKKHGYACLVSKTPPCQTDLNSATFARHQEYSAVSDYWWHWLSDCRLFCGKCLSCSSLWERTTNWIEIQLPMCACIRKNTDVSCTFRNDNSHQSLHSRAKDIQKGVVWKDSPHGILKEQFRAKLLP